jgi:general secretion pathway protein G
MEVGFVRKALPITAGSLILLAALAFLYVLNRGAANDGSVRSRVEIGLLAAKLEAIALDTGDFPAELAELSSPIGQDPRPYARERELLDPWGRPYYYRILKEKRSALVFTLGRDGVPGGRGPDADEYAQARRDES